MFLSSYHPEISKVITIDEHDIHAKGQGQGSKAKAREVIASFRLFRTVTPVWIHIWRKNDAKIFMLFWSALLFFKVIRHTAKKSSILTHIGRFCTVTRVWIHQWLWNGAQSLKQHMRSALLLFNVIHQFSRSRGTKNREFRPELSVSGM